MKAKRLSLLLVLLLCLSACGEGEGSMQGEPTVPLDRIAQALQDGNVGLYEAAFPGDFVAGYREQHSDLTETLSELLHVAREKNQKDCGEHWTLRYRLESKEKLSVENLESTCVLDRFNTFEYTVPKDRIVDAVRITVTVYLEGGMGEESFENTFTVLCIDGTWYLHPMHFGTVLRRS